MQLVHLFGTKCSPNEHRSGSADRFIGHDDLSVGCILFQTASGLDTVSDGRIDLDIPAGGVRHGRLAVGDLFFREIIHRINGASGTGCSFFHCSVDIRIAA